MRDIALTAAALIGVLTFVLTVICAALHVRPLVFMSGSMSPTIDAGALAFAQRTPIGDLKRGDIVSVITDKGSRVTHRVIAIDRTGAAPELRLKGDANPIEDRDPYIVPSADRVLFSIPHVGRGVAFISGPQGFFLLGVFVTGLLVFAFRPGLRRRRTRAIVLGFVLLITTLAFSNAPKSTLAYFTDSGTVTAAVSTAQVQSQANPACNNVQNFARLTWTQVDARYEYVWEVRNASTNNLQASGVVGSGIAQGATVTLDITTGLLGENVNLNAIIRARLTSATSWVAASTTTTPIRSTGILIISGAVRCGHN
jgi:signal peptidase